MKKENLNQNHIKNIIQGKNKQQVKTRQVSNYINLSKIQPC